MSTSMHLTRDQAILYRRGRLSPEDMKSVREHLSTCDSCQALNRELQTSEDKAAAAFMVGWQDASHLTLDEVEAFADETLGEEDRELIQAHLKRCESCRLQVEDHIAFAAELDRFPQAQMMPAHPTGGSESFLDWLRAAISGPFVRVAFSVACVIVIGLFATFRSHRPNSNPPTNQAVPTLPVTIQPQIGDDLPASDGGAPLDDHHYDEPLSSGLPDLPPLPPWGTGYVGPVGSDGYRGVLLPGPKLVFPTHEVVDSLKPKFVWRSFPQTYSYSVCVYDDHGVLEKSSAVHDTHWVPAAPLPSGEELSWRVYAEESSGDTATSPRADKPAEPFRTLSAANLKNLALARTVDATHPLALGIVLAQLGLYRDAESKVFEYVATHPDNRDAARLLKQLHEIVRKTS